MYGRPMEHSHRPRRAQHLDPWPTSACERCFPDPLLSVHTGTRAVYGCRPQHVGSVSLRSRPDAPEVRTRHTHLYSPACRLFRVLSGGLVCGSLSVTSDTLELSAETARCPSATRSTTSPDVVPPVSCGAALSAWVHVCFHRPALDPSRCEEVGRGWRREARSRGARRGGAGRALDRRVRPRRRRVASRRGVHVVLRL